MNPPAASPTEHNYHPRYRPDIDGLRALAILPVVVFHAFPRYAPGGFIGVDVFFVISGYLISLILFRSLASGTFSFAEFYAHRIRRIFPALILVLASCYAIGWFVMLPDEFKLLGKHIAAGAGFVENFVLRREAGYFDVAAETKPLLHLWSLAVEEQFYLVFPFFVWVLWRKRLNLFTGVLLVALVSFWLAEKGVKADAVKAFYYPHTRFWELMAGAILAYVQVFHAWPQVFSKALRWLIFNRVFFREVPAVGRQTALLHNLASALGLLLILASIASYHAKMPWPGPRALAPVLGAVLIIAAGPQAWVNRRLLSLKPMVWIGLISYPLYLWHWPLLAFLRIMEEGAMPAREWRIAAMAASFVLATLTYLIIEKPIRRGVPRVWKNTALCLLLALVGYIGYNAYVREGLAFRLKRVVESTAALLNEKNRPWDRENQEEICKLRFPFASDNAFCRLNFDRPIDVLLLGDSHAVSLYPGLAELLTQRRVTVANIGTGGCVPFRQLASFRRHRAETDQRHCLNIMTHALDTAAKEAKTIIFMSRGPVYLKNKGFELITNSPHEDYQDRVLLDPARPEINNHYVLWESAMRRTLAELDSVGKQIIYVLDNPELGFHPKSCFIRPAVSNIKCNTLGRENAAMGKRYSHLSCEERTMIQLSLEQGRSLREIA
ncbi:MAG: acyltransferase family protein, partial [Rhodocyclaceae bacterium]|nr:acyltransferase family protein [Rhodocyclaceae bacterium]